MEERKAMPFIRVNCPKGALTPEQKAKLAPRLVYALIRQEIDPVTEIGTAATGLFYNEVDVENCFPGGVSLTSHPEKIFWTVEAFVAASYFSQSRRDEMQFDIAKAFVDILGDDASVMQREDITIAPSWLMRLHVVIIEIPEGSWGAGGQTIDTEKISKLIGATQGPVRLAEALELGSRMKQARLS
jgi:phenylpyruvate tautomerase PptA (4-oxalocrotonate tautomerase family)